MRKDTSAGCCVVRKLDDRYQLLTIFRKWPDRKKGYTLPKGHKENNDSLEQTAIRETQEETGFTDIKIIKYLGSVNYFLDMKNGIDKTDHFFLAELKSDKTKKQELTDLEKKTGMKTAWKDLDNIEEILTWPNEKEIAGLVKKELLQ